MKGSLKSSIHERNSTNESPRHHSSTGNELKPEEDHGGQVKRVKFSRPFSSQSHRSAQSHESIQSYISAAYQAEIIDSKKDKNDIKRRVKKNQTIENNEAKHDLITALRVAMRKMLQEAIDLTAMNMRDNKREMKEIADQKKSKSQKKYLATIERQRQVIARHHQADSFDDSSNVSRTFGSSRRGSAFGLPVLKFNKDTADGIHR